MTNFLEVVSFDPLIVEAPKGDTGPQGLQGPQGEQGPQGPAGPAGGVVSVDGQDGIVDLSSNYAPISNVVYVDNFGGDPTGVLDSVAAVNAARAALPMVNGETVGVVQFGIGIYKFLSSPDAFGPHISIRGFGKGVTIIDYHGSGDALRSFDPTYPTSSDWRSIPFDLRIDGLTIDGTNAQPGACGLHYGDQKDGYIDITVQNFAGTGCIGFHLDNTVWWTEGTRGWLTSLNNDTAVILDVSDGPDGEKTSTNSFGYSDLYLDVYGSAGQNGVLLRNGAHYYNSRIRIGGTLGSSDSVNNSAVLSIIGAVPAGHPDAGLATIVVDCTLDICCEVHNYGANAPMTIKFGTVGSNGLYGVGVMSFAGFAASNLVSATDLSGTFKFLGTLKGDSNLNPQGGSVAVAVGGLAGHTTPQPIYKSGRYYATPVGASANVALTSGQLALSPLWVPMRTAFDRIGTNIATAGAAGSTLTFGIYLAGIDGEPGSLLLNCGTVAADVTGYQESVISQALPSGLYWVGALFLAAAGTVSVRAISSSVYPTPGFSGAQAIRAGLFASGLAALPAVPTINVSSGLNAPEVILRAA